MEEPEAEGRPGLLDVLLNPTIAELVLGGADRPGFIRLVCKGLRERFDRQVTRLRTNIQHAGDVELAKQLARKGVRPGTLSLDWGASDDVAAACGAALASGELQPLLQDVTSAQLTHHAVVLPSQLFMGLVRAMPKCQDFLLCADGSQPVQPPIVDDFCRSISALTALTALTKLSIEFKCVFGVTRKYTRPSTQAALASVLSALPSLKELSVPNIQTGPIIEALSQLTSLTLLRANRLIDINCDAPLTLPSARVLDLSHAWLQLPELCGIRAPRLQHVPVNLAVSPGHEAEFKQATEGLLQHCADLTIQMQQQMPERDLVALMSALRDSWGPTSTATNGYHHALPAKYSARGDTASPTWVLELCYWPCSGGVLQQLPRGITHLVLKSCTLQPDSLHPLAHFASLRQLRIRSGIGLSMAALQHLLATAEQGSRLTILVSRWSSNEEMTEVTLRDLHSAVAEQRGAQNTPALLLTAN